MLGYDVQAMWISTRGMWVGLAARVAPTTWGFGAFIYDPRYEDADSLTSKVFEEVKSVAGHFLSITKGYSPSPTALPGQSSSICFPSRFLRKPTLGDLREAQRTATNEILDNCFSLGLYTHLITYLLPTTRRTRTCGNGS